MRKIINGLSHLTMNWLHVNGPDYIAKNWIKYNENICYNYWFHGIVLGSDIFARLGFQMKILFSTNLDEAKGYVSRLNECWREDFGDHVPAVGTNIEFKFNKWDHGSSTSRVCSFDLGVSSVRYALLTASEVNYGGANVLVELHMPKNFRYMNHGIQGADDGSIAAWMAYFRKHVLGKDY